MISEPYDEAPKPRLQLQVIRGGRGPGGKTAIAVQDHEPEDYEWPEVPGWFRLIAWWHITRWRRAFFGKTAEQITEVMHAARVPQPVRLLTYWRWKLWGIETIDARRARTIVQLLRVTKFASNVIDESEIAAIWLLSRKIILTPTSWRPKPTRSSDLIGR